MATANHTPVQQDLHWVEQNKTHFVKKVTTEIATDTIQWQVKLALEMMKAGDLPVIDISKLPHTASNSNTIYWNIDKLDYEGVVNSMYDEITGLKEKALKDSLITIWELYEFLNKNNQDLTEEDFWDLLYDYLEWDLTIESLKTKYNLDDKVLNTIKTDLLFWQEINSKELEKKAQQLEEEAKIKWITLNIQQNLDKQEEENRKQEEENRKQEKLRKEQREWIERLKTSKKIQANLDAMSKKLWGE